MSISRYMIVAALEVRLCLQRMARAPVELGEAAVAVSDEGTHAKRIAQRHGPPVVTHCGLDFGSLATGSELAQEPEGECLHDLGMQLATPVLQPGFRRPRRA